MALKPFRLGTGSGRWTDPRWDDYIPDDYVNERMVDEELERVYDSKLDHIIRGGLTKEEAWVIVEKSTSALNSDSSK